MSPRVLILSQVYVPDSASVGQHLHEVARELVRRGAKVNVVCSARGYNNPLACYPKQEVLDGVEIHRVGRSALGKQSLAARLLGSLAFLAEAMVKALRFRAVDLVLVSTSPPLAPPVGVVLSRYFSARLLLWVMDINPDQAVALGAFSESSPFVRGLDQGMRWALRAADCVVTLDGFMAERLKLKGTPPDRLHIIPPWPLAEQQPAVAHQDNPFRQRHGYGAQRVLMYSGNISAVHPVDTLLEGLRECADVDRLRLVFVGGGTGLGRIRAFAAAHPQLPIEFLPYQPREELLYSLSAADIHLVSVGASQVGIVHPCKIYGALALGRPVLALSPERSHLADLAEGYGVGWVVAHGDVDGAARCLSELARAPQAELDERGAVARKVHNQHFDRNRWLNNFCDLAEALT